MNFNHGAMYVIFIPFVIMMTIIVSNMLVGLAVDDIKGIKDFATAHSQTKRIKFLCQ